MTGEDPEKFLALKRRWGWRGEIPRGSSMGFVPKIRLAIDSPLEETGFRTAGPPGRRDWSFSRGGPC